MKRLVMQKTIHIPLLLPIFDNPLISPSRPMVRCKRNFHRCPIFYNHLIYVLTPKLPVADLGSSRCNQIVHRMGHFLCRTHGFQLREINHQLNGSFSSGNKHKLHIHTIYGQRTSFFSYFHGRLVQILASSRQSLP